MPELPEVHTTVFGIKNTILNKTIKDVWSDFHIKSNHNKTETIKNFSYLKKFKKIVISSKIIDTERIGKNILIHLETKDKKRFTIIIHMKMTGHLMYGVYKKVKNEEWKVVEDGPLKDPFNKFIHFVLTLDNEKHLVMSDMRKFGRITIIETSKLKEHNSLSKIGIDALDKNLKWQNFYKIIKNKNNLPIKTALLDQSGICGIGNIYSDEILFETSIHPLSKPNLIPETKYKEMFNVMKKILKLSIKKGGDSKSDYRNIFGEKGSFQNFHKAYGRKNKHCLKTNCKGIINRMVIKGRSAHFCNKHQIKY